MVHRLLLLRPDIRDRTSAILHWMPYIRMDAPWPHQHKLDFAARNVDTVIGIGKRLLQRLSSRQQAAERMFEKTVPDEAGRKIAVNLVQHSTFVRNFFELGTEEIRDLPNVPDVSSLLCFLFALLMLMMVAVPGAAHRCVKQPSALYNTSHHISLSLDIIHSYNIYI